MHNLAGIVVLLWVLSSGAGLLHVHDYSGHDGGRDEAPCSICVATHHVPFIGLSKPEPAVARQDVAVWISPWIAMLPEEVFFDRPLARGPPSVS